LFPCGKKWAQQLTMFVTYISQISSYS
jgi:hypothetical protein